MTTEWLEQQYRPWKISTEVVDVEKIVDRWARMSASYLERADVERHFDVIEAMTEPDNPLTATLLRHLKLS